MGQKVHPITFRLGKGQRKPRSVWYAKQSYADMIQMDYKIRQFVMDTISEAGISDVNIERTLSRVYLTISCARPGLVIGKKGEGIEQLKRRLAKKVGLKEAELGINIIEVKKPDLHAALVAQQIAKRIEKRGMYRRVMSQHIASVMKAGAVGVRICLSGRLGGAEIARSEWLSEGRMQLHTIRSDIDFEELQAHTTYGVIGVKVWICVDKNKRKFSKNQKNDG